MTVLDFSVEAVPEKYGKTLNLLYKPHRPSEVKGQILVHRYSQLNKENDNQEYVFFLILIQSLVKGTIIFDGRASGDCFMASCQWTVISSTVPYDT